MASSAIVNIRIRVEIGVRSLKNKTVFITGASRGIGRAIALRVALDGANILTPSYQGQFIPSPKRSRGQEVGHFHLSWIFVIANE